MQHSSPIVSSGMESLVQDLQSCRGDNERKIKAKLEKGKSSWRNALRPCAPSSRPTGCRERRVQVYLCMRRSLKEMTVNPLAVREGSRQKAIRYDPGDLCSTWISISKGVNLHHSSFVKYISQFLSCCVSSRFELLTQFRLEPFLFLGPGQSRPVMVENVINQIVVCIIIFYSICMSLRRVADMPWSCPDIAPLPGLTRWASDAKKKRSSMNMQITPFSWGIAS